MTEEKRWARQYDACIDCGDAERQHRGGGRCAACYQKRVRAKRAQQPPAAVWIVYGVHLGQGAPGQFDPATLRAYGQRTTQAEAFAAACALAKVERRLARRRCFLVRRAGQEVRVRGQVLLPAGAPPPTARRESALRVVS